MPVFRIGHASDLHLSRISDRLNPILAPTADTLAKKSLSAFRAILKNRSWHAGFYPSTFNPDVAVELLRTLAKDFTSLDALVVTGDLATTGNDDDVAIARDYFFGKIPPDWNPASFYPSLTDSLPFPLVTLPGNHDRYETIALLPTSKAFERHFSDTWDFGRQHVYGIDGVSDRVKLFALQKGTDALVVVLADLSLESRSSGEGVWGWIGQGLATAEIVGDLVKSTEFVREQASEGGVGAAFVWAVHFPPSFPNNGADLELLNSSELVGAAHDCGVHALLTGHTHRELEYSLKRDRPRDIDAASHAIDDLRVFCSGASCGIGPENLYSFATIDITVEGGQIISSSRRVYRYDSNIRTFI